MFICCLLFEEKTKIKKKRPGMAPFSQNDDQKSFGKMVKKLWHFLAHKLWQNICLIGPIITDDHNVCLSLSVEYEIGVRSGTWYFLQSLFYALSKMGWSSSRPKTFLQCPIFRKVKTAYKLAHICGHKLLKALKVFCGWGRNWLRTRPRKNVSRMGNQRRHKGSQWTLALQEKLF